MLRKILKNTPNDPLARKLLRQITDDPHKLLGNENYPYRVKPGETLWGLAQRVLGDPMMFYALARYNDIAVPRALAAGATIRIPGKLRVETPPSPPKPVEKPAEKPAEKPVAAPTPAPSAAAPAHNPARATKLRAAGLAAMNKGAIDRAVLLLRQAQQADPANPLIARDLDRARKIQATASFPPQPSWFRSNLDFPKLSQGLSSAGFAEAEAALVLGGAWHRFLKASLPSARDSQAPSR